MHHHPRHDTLAVSPEGPVGNIWEDDSVEVFLSPANDAHYLHVAANALGRAFVQEDRGDIREFPHPVEHRITRDGWTVSLVIPFEMLGGEPEPNATWGLQLCRNKHTEPTESMTWMATATTYRDPSAFGRLVFE